MSMLRTAALTAVILSGAALPAAAMTIAPLAGLPSASVEKTEFTFGDQLFPSRLGRLERIDATAAQAAAQSYFDFDAIITLGALALAGGAMAGAATMAARRRVEEKTAAEPAWKQTVFRAVQADLAAFTETYRRAA